MADVIPDKSVSSAELNYSYTTKTKMATAALNQQACFIEPENYPYYLALWEECAGHYGVTVHAYCLMTNHIHFLATPATEIAISDTSKVVGSRYTQYINKTYRRTGTLWEGRHLKPGAIRSLSLDLYALY